MSLILRRSGPIAAVLAAVCAASGGSSFAADLSYDDPPNDRWSSAYEDPRYNYLYGREPAPPPPVYVEGQPPRPYGFDRVPVPREPVYPEARRLPPRYAEAPRHYAYSARPGCISKDAARYELERMGWTDFHDPHVADQDTAYVKARRPSGRLFQLQVDRCTGDIMSATPLEPRYRPYAERWEWRPPRTY